MQDQNQTTNPVPVTDAPMPIIGTPATDGPLGSADTANAAEIDPAVLEEQKAKQAEMMKDVANRINDAHNILIALSSDPSVDEIAAAIGTSLYLDKIGKRATAIYSGKTPNALEFLKPEETFDTDTDVLQDFVIALNKEKADHLRYKLDGDYVKIFITPYKTRIDKDDLAFSYGDFNIDLVLALNVSNGADLDAALREHGRIMHDATIVNVTMGNPGKFGEVEWSNKRASSVSEMLADLLYGMSAKNPIEPEEATAFLTGIIAATDRFSNTSTTPDTMQVASRLMESGADQQLITQNISETGNFFSFANASAEEMRDDDPTSLSIEHEDEAEGDAEGDETDSREAGADAGDAAESSAETTESDLPDLGAVADSLAANVVPVAPVEVDAGMGSSAPILAPSPEFQNEVKTEKVVAPSSDFVADASGDNGNKYSQMLEDALNEANAAATPMVTNPAEAAPIISDATAPVISDMAAPVAPAPVISSGPMVNGPAPMANEMANAPMMNPAASVAPTVNNTPEINGVPEINYAPLSVDEVLPPPPTPPIDMNSPTPPTVGAGAPAAEGSAPQPTNAPNAGAFQIPGAQ